jgi:hypothetical protein
MSADRIDLPAPSAEGFRDRKYDVRFGKKIEELEERLKVLEEIVDQL